MEVKAIHRYARISPLKGRQLAAQLKGLPAEKALQVLKFVPMKIARLIEKVLKSAISNAENNHNIPSLNLQVSSVRIDEGSAFKRFQPVSRGSAHPIRKRTSHIQVHLSEALKNN